MSEGKKSVLRLGSALGDKKKGWLRKLLGASFVEQLGGAAGVAGG